MKRCPECRRDYSDDSLHYCLDDGRALLDGPGNLGLPASELPTRHQIDPVDQTAALPNEAEAEPQESFGSILEKRNNAINRTAKPLIFALVAAVLLVAGFFGYRYLGSNNKQVESIAVMPFVNASGNADLEYLSDGMTETLISSLSRLRKLDVKPRSSVFQYKGRSPDPQAVGRDLKVQAVLTGRVVNRGHDLLLYVELIDVILNKVVWSETYDRKDTDIVTLQADIARDISSRLKTKLTAEDEAIVTKSYTVDPEAYQLYLHGNFYRAKYTEDGYKKAIEYYQRAIVRDPKYALPHTGIAYAYIIAADWYVPTNEAVPKATAEALRALELDNTIAEAHGILGGISMWYEYDWARSSSEFKRAIDLDPSIASIHEQYSIYLAATEHFDEAIKEAELARRLAPLDLQINASAAMTYVYAGKYDEAIDLAMRTLEMDQNYWFSHQALGLAYERKKMYPQAIAELEKAHSLDNNMWVTGFLGYAYAVGGRKQEAQKILSEMKELGKQRYMTPYALAFVCAGLDEKDQAFEWLDKAYESHSGLAQIKIETVFENLRPDPRFKTLVKRINLPE